MDLRRAWRIADQSGTDRTDRLAPWLQTLTIYDRPGRLSDEAVLTLTNDPFVELPTLSKALRIWIGEDSSELVDIGAHYVTDYGLEGPPERLQVVCRPTYFGGGTDPEAIEAPVKSAQTIEQVWPAGVTLQTLGQQIADRLGLDLSIDPEFAPFIFESIEQRHETDPGFITRAGRLAGAIVKLVPGILVIGTPHAAQSYGSGSSLPTVDLEPSDVSGYQFGWSARSQPGKVVAFWQDLQSGQSGVEAAGDEDPGQAIPKTFGSQAEASRAARAAFSELQRGNNPANVTLNALNLGLWFGSRVTFGSGWHPQVRGTWTVRSATHALSSEADSTTIQIERQT